MVRGVRRGCVRLKGAMIGIDDEDNLTFTVTVDSKTFHFQARTRADRELWIRALEDTIQKQLYGYRANQIQVGDFFFLFCFEYVLAMRKTGYAHLTEET